MCTKIHGQPHPEGKDHHKNTTILEEGNDGQPQREFYREKNDSQYLVMLCRPPVDPILWSITSEAPQIHFHYTVHHLNL